MKMNIRTKLIGGFLIVVALLLVVFAIFLWAANARLGFLRREPLV